ncbi:hypothetical protein ZWY2020_047947 [Hordeum vulgare]|nr:hypothetical protein ZWY2020_047947 [Hordeum vulgare]
MTDPVLGVEEVLSGCEADSRKNDEKEKSQMCSDSETESQFNGEPHEFDLLAPPPYSLGVTASRDESINKIQRPKSTTPNIEHSPLCGHEQSSWNRRYRFGKISDKRQPQQGRVCALEKAMCSYDRHDVRTISHP